VFLFFLEQDFAGVGVGSSLDFEFFFLLNAFVIEEHFVFAGGQVLDFEFAICIGNGGEARIVNTSSAAHLNARLDLDDLQCRTGYGAMKAYGRSKLCNILFTRELARRLTGTKVTANCLHPGFVATRFGDEAGGLISRFAGLAKLLAVSPEDGAKTLVYLASSPHVARMTGRYFYMCRPLSPSRAATVSGKRARLRLTISDTLSSLRFGSW